MAEMSDGEVRERLGRYRTKRAVRTAAIVVVAVAVVAVVACLAVGFSARRAEKVRVESVLKKPLLDWSEAERAEFPEEYETRRQRERADEPALWTAAEKKAEWWSYSKLVVKSKFRRAASRRAKTPAQP